MISSRDVRKDIDLLNRTIAFKSRLMREQFIDDDGPSVLMGKAIEKIGLSLSTMQNLYKSNAQNRDAIKPEFISELQEICDLSLEIISKLKSADPEDQNRGI